MDVKIACVCGRHERDTVTLRDRLDFRGATTVRGALGLASLEDPDISPAELIALLREQYILQGVSAWTLRNGSGPLPLTKPNIREHLLTHLEQATAVAEAADELYSEQVVLPLVTAVATSSPPGPTAESTSPKSGGRHRNQKPSSRSSIASIPTDDTGRTTSPPDGGSN